MRIVVSGTHCSGKSTLVSDFLAAHRDYVHEPEPWEWLVEVYHESLSEEPDGAVDVIPGGWRRGSRVRLRAAADRAAQP